MRVDLVFQGFEFGLGFGGVQLFDPGFVVFFFEVEEGDLIDIGNEAGGDNDDEDGIDQVVITGLGFAGREHPEAEEQGGEGAGVDDVGEEEGDDEPVIRSPGPGYACADIVHEPDVSLPNHKCDHYEEQIRCRQFRIGI